MPQHWLWCRNAAGEKPVAITLFKKGYLHWNEQRNYGWWDYSYDEKHDVGYFIIEFTAGKSPEKRHFFVQVEDDRAILLPPNHSVYTQEHLWYFKRSVVHANTETIELKKDCTMSPLLWLNCKFNASGANGWWKGKYDTACDDNSQEVEPTLYKISLD